VASTDVTKPLGLRERKKRRTRQAILDTAIQLFWEQGYEATTITQIAETVDIAPSTVFKYFPTKVEMVFSMLDAIIDSARASLLERAEGVSAVDAVIGWIEKVVPEVEAPYTGTMREIPTIVESSPELEAEQRLRIARVEDMFAEAFAADVGGTADGVEARVMAAIALRGMTEIWVDWHRQHADDPSVDTHEVCRLKAEYLRKALPAGMAAIRLLPPTLD
jgi:AcrR family transcriptional regulator